MTTTYKETRTDIENKDTADLALRGKLVFKFKKKSMISRPKLFWGYRIPSAKPCGISHAVLTKLHCCKQ